MLLVSWFDAKGCVKSKIESTTCVSECVCLLPIALLLIALELESGSEVRATCESPEAARRIDNFLEMCHHSSGGDPALSGTVFP